jgi:hypothetical protein
MFPNFWGRVVRFKAQKADDPFTLQRYRGEMIGGQFRRPTC